MADKLIRTDREVTVSRILDAAGEDQPSIVPSSNGYAFCDRNGCTFGQREASREALVARWIRHETAKRDEFAARLRAMTVAQLEAQRVYWLK